MTIQPAEDECYEPPPDEECDEFSSTLDLAANVRMGTRQMYMRGTSELVYFAVWQSHKIDGRWEKVVRVDCHHGTVHRHDFARSGDNEMAVLDVIPVKGGTSEFLGSWCTRIELVMQNEWEANLRRWHGDKE
ncbi:hypothetical protein [Micromonospora sp. NPDC005710]|uniref:DUF7718 family protein n=1 Tax=Micromonospora sp. NPDC005710 TaxID=3157051 RepID=UPI0033FCDB8D